MTLSTKRIVSLYLFLLLLLAFLGSGSQSFYRLHKTRLAEKNALISQLSEKREQVIRLSSADKVIRWAESHGMVPAASPLSAIVVPAVAKPPLIRFEAAKSEIKTRW